MPESTPLDSVGEVEVIGHGPIEDTEKIFCDGQAFGTESQLISCGTSGTIVAIDGGDSTMSDDSEDLLEQGIAMIRKAFAARGKQAVDEFVANLQSTVGSGRTDLIGPKRVTRHPDAEKAIRAPAGSARVLCRRVLGEAKNNGLTVMKINEKATGEYERMLSRSAIRNELSVGERLEPPLYKQVGGVWYLAEYAPMGMRIVS